MPDICPFQGVLYNPKMIKDLSMVVTEPYDVISPSQQRAYYKMHPCNIIRLILGKDYSADNAKNNRYTRAKEFFAAWLKKDILLRDQKENIYIYTQSYPYNNKIKTRTGFIVLLKLEDFAKNTILPHENTFSKPVNDRFQLLKEARANLSPIFALFSESEGKISKLLSQHKKTHQSYFLIKKDKTLHRLWRMSDKRSIAQIKRLLKDKQIFIADGHHRYEAALNYKMQMQQENSAELKLAPFNYVMAYLVPSNDRGLTILPTHRVIKIKGPFKPEASLRNLRKTFQVDKFSTSEQLFAYMQNAQANRIFGAYFGKNKFYGLKLRKVRMVAKNLDVTILHTYMFAQLLNKKHFQEDIYYTRDAQEAIKLIDEHKYQAAFFLKSATLTQVQRIARSGLRMPHKTTYFYPKALTGLVINKFNNK